MSKDFKNVDCNLRLYILPNLLFTGRYSPLTLRDARIMNQNKTRVHFFFEPPIKKNISLAPRLLSPIFNVRHFFKGISTSHAHFTLLVLRSVQTFKIKGGTRDVFSARVLRSYFSLWGPSFSKINWPGPLIST